MVLFHRLLYISRPGPMEFVVLNPSEESTIVTGGVYSLANLIASYTPASVLCEHLPYFTFILHFLKFTCATALALVLIWLKKGPQACIDSTYCLYAFWKH